MTVCSSSMGATPEAALCMTLTAIWMYDSAALLMTSRKTMALSYAAFSVLMTLYW